MDSASTDGKPGQEEELRKVQRTLHELCKRLDDRAGRCRLVSDLFQPELTLLRVKLRDYTLKLWSHDPVKHGAHAVDLYWKKAVYETLALARNIKQGWTPVERGCVQAHLLHSAGHFHHLLALIDDLDSAAKKKKADPGQELGVVDLFATKQYGHAPTVKQSSRAKGTSTYDAERLKAFLCDCAHKCLTCLGDTHRYLLEFGANAKLRIAQRYYYQALALDPTNGSPYNQLAALTGTVNHGLDGALFYLRGLVCGAKQFKGLEANLKNLLDRNERLFVRYDQEVSNLVLPELSQSKATERCAVYHLKLVKAFLFGDMGRDVSDICQKALQAVQHCLYQPVQNEYGSPVGAHLPPKTMMTNMVLILVVLMEILENDELKLSMLKAYVLAFFSHLVTKVLADLHIGLHGPESLLMLFETPEEKTKREEEERIRLEEEEEEKQRRAAEREMRRKKKGNNKLDRFKRRRKRGGGESSSEDTGEEDTYDTESAEESSASSRRSGSGSASDASSIFDSDSDSGGGDEGESDDTEDVVIESTEQILSVTNLIRLVGENRLNPALRVCCAFLTHSKSVVLEAAREKSDVIWDRLAKFFTILSLDNSDYVSSEQVTEVRESCKGLLDRAPLEEDFEMRGLKAFERHQRDLDWGSPAAVQVEAQLGLNVLRILDFMSFRDWLCAIPECGLTLKEDSTVAMGERRAPKKKSISPVGGDSIATNSKAKQQGEDSSAVDTKRSGVLKITEAEEKNGGHGAAATKRGATEDEKQAMMKNMAQRWLQQEVDDLEGKGAARRGGFKGLAQYSPYLVVDHNALAKHLKLVKEVVASKKFAVIIPTAVIQELDSMKKSEIGARVAIRWLEKQFHDGNRWLRSQKKAETKGLEAIQCPKKKDREAWSYFKILECCNYFGSLHGEASSSLKVRVTLLTSSESDGGEKKSESGEGGGGAADQGDDGKKTPLQAREFNPRGVAESLDIRMENIDEFLQKSVTSKPAKSRRLPGKHEAK